MGIYSHFEPNEVWAGFAERNLRSIGTRFTLTRGAFEENLDKMDKKVDLAFIDAIHTSTHVLRQLTLLEERASSGALIFLDDINFSEDMQECWHSLAASPEYRASATIGKVGLLELR